MMRLLRIVDTSFMVLFSFLPALAVSQTVDFTSSNLPVIVIDTHGQDIPDEPKITADMGIIDNGVGKRNAVTDAFNGYTGKIGIEVRGSVSQMFPKLQYGVETRDTLGNPVDVSLLGLPAENDWVLSAGYSDKTLLRNALAYHLANGAGRYASRSRFFELVLNGNYMGVYVLFEKIKRTKNRVNVSKMDSTDVSGDAVTGGYIIRVDKENADDDGWYSPYLPFPGATQQILYLYDYPKPGNIVPEQKSYIQTFMTSFETRMNDTDFADPATGYTTYLDLNSAVDFFLINEISKNVDGYRLSSYMYKDKDSKGGKLTLGPVWDFDIAFGNADFYDAYDSVGWDLVNMPATLSSVNDYQIPFWWTRLSQDTTFWNVARTRWATLWSNQFSLSTIYGFIDSLTAYLDEAQQRNFQCWPILGAYVWPNYYVGATYADEISYLKHWLDARIHWMDGALGIHLDVVKDAKENAPRVFVLNQNFPNPFNPTTTITFSVPKESNVKLEVFNLLGELVGRLLNERKTAGTYSVTFDASGLSSGMYLYRMSSDHFVSIRKLVVLK